ncbi:MAG: ACP S-malonyltransferase [Spirochaetes bacterium]|nr:ACP S-malonyltransferase [Spirochaetota bacterium]
MASYTFLFPGQGSQKPGMGKQLYDDSETAREVFRLADKTLDDICVTSLCFDADEDELVKTENTQPALFTVSYAIYRMLVEHEVKADVFAGQSLGEYMAVACAGFLGFSDGLRIVRKRGLLMRDCDPQRKGGMAAIIGLDGETIAEICREVGECFPANFNSPRQIVISGLKKRVQEAADRCKERGAKRAVVLNVGAAFHSPYMAEVANELKRELEKVQWRAGENTVISNATAECTKDPETLRQNLIRQLTSPVLWSLSMQRLVEKGNKEYIEAGPGTVLKGLFRNISREATVHSVETLQDAQAIAEQS